MTGRTWTLFAFALALAAGCDSAPPAGCESSRDCSAAGLVCDVVQGECVECLSNNDCLGEGEVCRGRACEVVTPCVSSRECPGLVCDPARGFCVECVGDVDCPGEETCDGEGFCQEPPPPCASDRECSELGLVCDMAAGACVECVRDADCVGDRVCVANLCINDVDAGIVPTDAGPPPSDDAGPPGIDAGPPSDDAGPPGVDAGPPSADAGPPGTDAGPPMCHPGSVLVLLDASGSMNEAPASGGSTKWARATNVLTSVLATLPNTVHVGLMFLPTGGTGATCAMPVAGPAVPIGPLSTTRSMISSAIAARTPDGAVTPLWAAIGVAHDALAVAPGPRGLIVIGDGADNCPGAGAAAIGRVNAARAAGTQTHVIGIANNNNDMSRLAVAGGTRTSAGCLDRCVADACQDADDCGGATTCGPTMFPGANQCQCTTDADCPSPLTCTSNPFFGSTCGGTPNCCHADVRGASLDVALRAALNTSLSAITTGCP